MRLSTRKLLSSAFSFSGFFSLFLMCTALAVLLIPIFIGGTSAFVFKETIEGREYFLKNRGRGDPEEMKKDMAAAQKARQPMYDLIEEHEAWLDANFKYGVERQQLREIKGMLRGLFGPFPGEAEPTLPRERYGDTRWDRAQVHLDEFLYRTEYVFADADAMGVPKKIERAKDFEGMPLAKLFPYIEENFEAMMRPERRFYWRFIFDNPDQVDQYFFGGIWPSVLGTLYLAIGTMLIAGPMGVISAIYLTEYAGDSKFISFLRTCISTLAGVPSIVFALFGITFFMGALQINDSKPSVVIGCLVLSLLVLPTVIRASEEAIRSVPRKYKEASLSLGATKWTTILKVILPAALPGIITSIIISMGRAAGETAPIMFTAAISQGAAVAPRDVASSPTCALSYSIYSMINTEPQIEEVRHVQYGMLLTLISLVLLLNLAAILLRARVSKKLKV